MMIACGEPGTTINEACTCGSTFTAPCKAMFHVKPQITHSNWDDGLPRNRHERRKFTKGLKQGKSINQLLRKPK